MSKQGDTSSCINVSTTRLSKFIIWQGSLLVKYECCDWFFLGHDVATWMDCFCGNGHMLCIQRDQQSCHSAV